MKSRIEIDSEQPEQLREIIGLSLESTDKVNYGLKTGEGHLTIEVETDGLGPLRGCTDTVFRLTSLTRKLY